VMKQISQSTVNLDIAAKSAAIASGF
jgi:hypothetical protein